MKSHLRMDWSDSFAGLVALALTPAFSRWERENHLPSHENSYTGFYQVALGKSGTEACCSLSQREKAGVREKT